MIRLARFTRGDAFVGGIAVGGAAVAGWLATHNPALVTSLIGVAVVGWVLFASPPRVLVWIAGAGVLVAPGVWPILVTVAGVDVLLGDVLIALAVLAALVRHRQRRVWWLAAALVVMLACWAVLRSEPSGDLAFARIVLPLLVMLAVTPALPEGFDLRRDLRWFPIATLVSVPLVGGLSLLRWSSIAGGSNETGLIGAAAILLGFTYRDGWRYLLWAVGLMLLGGSAAIAASLAAGAGIVYYAVAPKVASRNLGSGSPLLALWGLTLGVTIVPLLRVDVVDTIDAHLFQISKLGRVLEAGNPTLGLGWGNIDRAAFFNSDVVGLHNVYLDVFAYLGVIGAVPFAGLLVAVWIRGDVVARTLLIAWAVWVNTAGAFPGIAWGFLGFVIAAAQLSQRRIETSPLPEVRRERPAFQGIPAT